MRKLILILLAFISISASAQYTTYTRPIAGKIVYAPSYSVERTFYFSCLNEFAGNTTESGYTWNSLKPTNAQITTANGFVYINALTEAGASSTVSVTNTTAFNGASASEANYIESPPVYPVAAVNGAFLFSSASTLRIGGLTAGKYYQIYLLTASSNSGVETSITIGGVTKTKTASSNYPPAGSDRFTNSNLVTFFNVTPISGNIDITFNKTGSYYQSPINLFFIQESSTLKP